MGAPGTGTDSELARADFQITVAEHLAALRFPPCAEGGGSGLGLGLGLGLALGHLTRSVSLLRLQRARRHRTGPAAVIVGMWQGSRKQAVSRLQACQHVMPACGHTRGLPCQHLNASRLTVASRCAQVTRRSPCRSGCSMSISSAQSSRDSVSGGLGVVQAAKSCGVGALPKLMTDHE